MKSLQQPSVGPFERERSPNDLDGLLRSYFVAQVPQPWPVLKPPAARALREGRVVARSFSLLRSRFALAASLLVLLTSQFFVSGMFSGFSQFAREGGRGRLEATNRIDSAMPREPKPALRLKKAEAIRPLGGDRSLIPGRR